MSPSAAAYMRPGAGLFIYNMQVQVHASMNPSTTSSVASLGNIGRWAVAPLQYIEVLHLSRWYTHTCSETSYRISDVEFIVRAKTLQLNLTG